MNDNAIMSNVKAMNVGIMLTLLTFLFGFGLGAVFGVFEHDMKEKMAESGQAVLKEAYNSEQSNLDAVLKKSWRYIQRAHFHAGGMAAAAMGMILLMACMGGSKNFKGFVAFLLGVGGLGYAAFWLIAGWKAPALGGTDVAKDALELLAVSSSGCFIVGLFGVMLQSVCQLFRK